MRGEEGTTPTQPLAVNKSGSPGTDPNRDNAFSQPTQQPTVIRRPNDLANTARGCRVSGTKKEHDKTGD